MIVAADATGLEVYRDWAFVTSVGARFDCIINSTPGRWRSREAPGIVHFVCYGNAAGYRPQIMNDPEEQRAWVEDFLKIAPALRGRIVGHHIQTWEHCFRTAQPPARGCPG